MWIKRSSLNDYIDSIKITDIITETIFVRDLKDSSKITVENPDLNDFYLQIWYTKTPVGVTESTENANCAVYPVPAKNTLTIKSDLSGYSYKIMNVAGKEVLCGKSASNEKKINISGLSAGAYNAIIYQANKVKYIRKFIIE
jgi:hypothetical protein